MSRTSSLLLLCAALAAPALTHAAGEALDGPLTQSQAVERALRHNPRARAALAELEVARGRALQAGLLPNPELELEVTELGQEEAPGLALGVDFSLSAALLAPLRAAAEAPAVEAARLDAAQVLLAIAHDARLAWLETAAAQRRLTVVLGMLENQQAAFATAKELHAVGNLPALALAEALSAVELARLQVAEVESALLDARERLSRAMGATGAQTGWTIGGGLDEPSAVEPSGAEEQAVAVNLALAGLERRAERARRSAGVAAVEGWLPHLSAGVHGERHGERWALGLKLTVGIPSFDRNQGRVHEAHSQHEALAAQLEAQAVAVRSMVRQALNRVESARARAHHHKERLLPARTQALEQTLLHYNAMQVGVFEVLRAQRAVQESAAAQLEATLDYWKARAALDLLLAGGTPELTAALAPGRSADASPAADRH